MASARKLAPLLLRLDNAEANREGELSEIMNPSIVSMVGLAVVATAIFGCANDGPPPLDTVSSCSDAWQPLTSPRPFDLTSTLGYKDGVLYYSVAAAPALIALPVGGGAPTPTLLAPQFTRELWVDGDQLLYTGGDLGNQIFGVPLAGGSPALLLDGAAGRTDAGFALMHVLTVTDVFWTEQSRTSLDAPTTVWRAARSGGAPVQIGSATARVGTAGDLVSFEDMALSGDAVLLATILGIADAVPLDGSPVRALATVDALTKGTGWLAGIDGSGVYWSLPRAGAPAANDEWVVSLAPADGSPVRTFWEGLPPHSAASKIWPSGDGGWVIATNQLFDDHQLHVTIWRLDADGTGRRLACSPLGGSENPRIDVGPAVLPDAIYFIASGGNSWQMVGIAR